MVDNNKAIEESKYLVGLVTLFPVLAGLYMLIVTLGMVTAG